MIQRDRERQCTPDWTWPW